MRCDSPHCTYEYCGVDQDLAAFHQREQERKLRQVREHPEYKAMLDNLTAVQKRSNQKLVIERFGKAVLLYFQRADRRVTYPARPAPGAPENIFRKAVSDLLLMANEAEEEIRRNGE